MTRTYQLYADGDNLFVGILDMTPGDSYGAVFMPTDTQYDDDSETWIPTLNVTRFNEWNAAQPTPLVVPALGTYIGE